MADTITHRLIEKEAQMRGWKVLYYGGEDKFLRVETHDGRANVFRGSRPNNSPANSVDVTRDKFETLEFVKSLGYSVPESIKATGGDVVADFLEMHKRIVIKPLDSDKSQGVTVDITSQTQIDDAFSYARPYALSGEIIAQTQITGNLYRILVLDGSVVAVTERQAASVTGDGTSTVRELIEAINCNPLRGKGSQYALQAIDISSVEEYIGSEKLESVLGDSEMLRVSRIESVSAGGMAIDKTDCIHASWVTMATRIVSELNLFIAGFDIMTEDISLPMKGSYVPLLEINSRPGQRSMNIHQWEAQSILRRFFSMPFLVHGRRTLCSRVD